MRGEKGDGAILRFHLPRASPTAQAGLQPQSLGCLAGPRLVTEWAAPDHGVTQPLEIAGGERFVDTCQPRLIAYGRLAPPETRIATKPAG